MSSRRLNRRPRRNKRQSGESVDREIAMSSQVIGKANVLAPAIDYQQRQRSFQLVQSPPRNFRESILWVRGKFQAIISISNSVPTENNFATTLSAFTDLAGLAGFFDQYCLYSHTCSITPSFEGAGSTLYNFGTCYTALDYDNVTNLGSADEIQAYNSCVTFEMTSGQSIQRFWKPCVAPAIYSASAAFAGYGVGRQWIDSSVTTVPHYGFRSYFISNTVSGMSVTFDVDGVIGFRNNI